MERCCFVVVIRLGRKVDLVIEGEDDVMGGRGRAV
jgi:hypothetical protein